jgi:uncharacterized protein (TIGR02271 family)
MSRTIAALFDSRAEADLARVRLASDLKAKGQRIIGKDTAGALDGLKIARSDADHYRDELRRGAFLLVGQVPSGTDADSIVELIEQSAEYGSGRAGPSEADASVAVEPARDEAPRAAMAKAPEPQRAAPREPAPQAQAPKPAAKVIEEERIPVASEELRVGKREVQRGGARVRSFTREATATEQVELRDEVVEIENRPSGRRLSDEELQAGGLFKQRAFEVAEMREEPVVTKIAVVREEVIVRKTIKERQETVSDTVRHTEIEVEDLADTDADPAPRSRAQAADVSERRRGR